MNVEELTDGKGAWTAWLQENGGGVNQTYEWGEFRRELGWKARRLLVKDGNTTRLSALILQKPLPLGFCFFYCPVGPVVAKGDWKDRKNQQSFTALEKHLKQLAKKERAIFFKIDPHVPIGDFPVTWLTKKGFRDSPEDIQPGFISQIDLTLSEDDILAGMKQKGRYNIRYAERKGVTVRSGAGAGELDIFYRLLKQTAERQGITHRSHHYFATFRKHFMEKADLATFFIAEYEGKPVAAILVTFCRDEAIYLYGGSDPQDRNIYASYFIQWKGMQEAKRRGAKYYNLTGVAHADDPSNPWYGLRQFKLKFGGPVIQLVGARDYIYQPALYFLFTNADRARRLIAKTLGRVRSQ